MAKEKEGKTVDALTVIGEKIAGMSKMLAETKVGKEEDLTDASENIKKVKQLGKYIEQEKEKYVKPAKEIIANARAKYDPYIKECENAESVLKGRVRAFMDEQDRARREEEAKIMAKVEAGRIKPETAVNKIEALPEIQKTVIAENSGIRRSTRKVMRITDREMVPLEYWIIDEVKLGKVALAGVPVPGTEVVEESIISSI